MCRRHEPDLAVVEGAGGWLVPLSADETMADLGRILAFPVVVVVGMRLGCLNHALLTVDAVRQVGLEVAGWVANRIDPDMPVFDDNLATLEARIDAPLIGSVPFLSAPPSVQDVADCLMLDRLPGVGA